MLDSLDMDHGNLKLSNVFVEFADRRVGEVTQKVPVLVISDRCLVGRPTTDPKAVANMMHQLVCGMQITFNPDGTPYYHHKVKNSPFFKQI